MNTQRIKKISNGLVISYMVTNIDINEQKVTIFMDISHDNLKLENDIFLDKLNGEIVEYVKDTYKYNLELSLCTSSRLLPGCGTEYEFKFINLKREKYEYEEGKPIFFHIPFLSGIMTTGWTQGVRGGGCRDYVEFDYKNKKWKLRLAYEDPYQQGKYTIYSKINHTSANGAGMFLETVPSKNDVLPDLESNASEICNLISFSLGKYANWRSVWCDCDCGLQLLRVEQKHICTEKGNIPTTVHDFQKVFINVPNPIEFIQNTYVEYLENKDWWINTLNWHINSRLSEFIEVKKMMESMLFDRVSKYVFSKIVLISTSLDLYKYNSVAAITNAKKGVKTQFENSLNVGRTRVKNDEESDFIQMCQTWICNPDFRTRISSLFVFAGGCLSDADADEICYRNDLVHNGEIPIGKDVSSIIEYDSRISKYCLSLILPLLGYGGDFSTPVERYSVSCILPNWERLKLSNITALANRLLK